MKPVLGADGNVKYYINDTPSETQVLDASGSLLYRYVKATDQTLDSRGNLYMRGNIILGLK